MAFDFPTNPPPGTPATTPDGAVRYWDGQKWDAAYGGPPGARDASNDLSIAQNATIARTLANRFADRYSVEDWLPQGQPDSTGTFDCAPYIQAALNAAAGNAQLLIPGNVNPYLLGNPGLVIPSNTHLIVEAGATLKMLGSPTSNVSCMDLGGSTNILIELRGTLDGNVFNMNPPPNVPGTGANGGIVSSSPCTNVMVRGDGLGVITNFKHWPVNITCATNVEVRGITMMNSGSSIEFAGISTRVAVAATGSSYTSGTGATVLSTAPTAHGIVPGQTFTYTGTTGNIPFANLMGEYVAGPGTGGTTVNFTGPVGLGPVVINGGTDTSNVGTCTKCYNVGFVDCIIEGIQDLGICFYGGVVGGYIRGCEVRWSSGPFIFNDNAQPGSNWDCEISNCYCHDSGGGPVITSNAHNGVNHRSLVFDNISANCYGGGLVVGAADGADVYGNLVHGCMPSCPNGGNNAGVNGDANVGGCQNVNFWNNTIRDPQPAIMVGGTNSKVVVAGSTYNNSTGAVSLQTLAPHNIPVGGTFIVQIIRSPTGNPTGLRGIWTATAGTTGTTLNYTAAPGLGTITFFDGAIRYNIPYPANNSIVSGTYDSLTGNVTLTTLMPHGITTGTPFILSGVTGTGAASLTGLQKATKDPTGTIDTAGSTIYFKTTAGLSAMTIAGGRILPPHVGVLFDSVYLSGYPCNRLRVVDNYIDDTNSLTNMAACLGGTWGTNGYSKGNVYGRRTAILADMSNYQPGLGGNVQGPSHDTVFETTQGNYSFTGYMNFTGAGGSAQFPVVLQPQGLTPSWNYTGGAGDVDFYCGRGAGAPGGFNFLQVAALVITGGSYTGGSGLVAVTTNAPHGMLPGSVFTVNNARNSSPGSNVLNGSQTATVGTTGVVLNYTSTPGLTLLGPINGGNVTTPGGTTIGIVSGTYTPAGGLVSLTLASAHGLSVGGSFVVASITDGDPAIASLNGSQTAIAGTAGNTLNFTDTTGLAITHPLTGGAIIPLNLAGGVVDTTVGVAGSLLANDGYGNTRLGGALMHGALQSTITSGGTVTIPPNTDFFLVQNTVSVAAVTVVLPVPSAFSFPSQSVANNELEINFQSPVGTLTVTAGGTLTISGVPSISTSIAAAGTSLNFLQHGSTWLRRIMA